MYIILCLYFTNIYVMLKFLKNIIVSILAYGFILYIVNQYSAWWFWVRSWFLVESTQYNVVLTFIVLALFFWIVNNIVKMVLKALTIPLKYLTLWLFSLVLNMLMIYIFEYLVNNSNIWVMITLGTIIQVFALSLIIALVYFLIKRVI